ncbi:MAG: magnesium transporter [Holosporales bacterium]|jgi:magnesium transporter|nr:magnesium transporter [Holosporales bacterium]
MIKKIVNRTKKKQILFESLLKEVKQAISDENLAQIFEILKRLHIADLADVIEGLRQAEKEKLVFSAGEFITAELLLNLQEAFRPQIIDLLGTQHFKESSPQLSNEDIFCLIQSFEEDVQQQFLEFLPVKRRKVIGLFLTYPEDSIGRCMSVDFIAVSREASVFQALEDAKRKTDLPENFAEFFVVDDKGHPIGVVFVKDVIAAPVSDNITKYMHTDIIPIDVNMKKEEATLIFNKYGIVRTPVLSPSGKIAGILRSDDILTIVSENLSSGILNVGGVSDSAQGTFWRGCFSRMRWIAVTVINASFSPLVIDFFQDIIQQVICLAILMPLVASIGGVVGIQSVSIIIKEMSEGTLLEKNFIKTTIRELLLGMVNGVVIGIALGCVVAAFWGSLKLGTVLSTAMFFSITWAAFIGSALPILCYKLGFDSAICSGPIVTTITDVSGFAIFLSLARLVLI